MPSNSSAPLPMIDIDRAFGVRFGSRRNLNVFCPFHEDDRPGGKPSCSVSAEGMFKCHVCEQAGSAVQFYAAVQGITEEKALKLLTTQSTPVVKGAKVKREIVAEPLTTTITERLVERCAALLWRTPRMLKYLREERGLMDHTIRDLKLGMDEYRITIPIYDMDGGLRNIRRYLPHAESSAKMLSHAHGDGSPTLFQWRALTERTKQPILLVEGEWDQALTWQMGYRSLTHTGGVRVWRDEWTDLLHQTGSPVVIMFDVNDVDADFGQRMAWVRFHQLSQAGIPVSVARLPLSDKYKGGDPTDFFVKAKLSQVAFDLCIARATTTPPTNLDDDGNFTDTTMPAPRNHKLNFGSATTHSNGVASHQNGTHSTPPPSATPTTPPLVSLHESTQSKYYYETIRFRALVAGRGSAPYLVPRNVSVRTTTDGAIETKDYEFDCWDGQILSLIDCSESQQHGNIKRILKVPPASSTVDVNDTLNLEQVFLIPPLDDPNNQTSRYSLSTAFYVGHGLETNRVYEFTAYALPDPRNQAATHILVAAANADTTLDNFRLKPDQITQLRAMLKGLALEDIAHDLSQHVTQIYGRPNLHIAIDLTFHSVLAFNFDGKLVRKGWLETIALGDTRTGKGCVAEGLHRFYKVGDVVSGENLTMAGLVAAVQKVGERWTLVWGKIPLADKGLLILDEVSSMSTTEISKLSRIRSEGVAEVTKAVSERTNARTRLIWLANPRPRYDGMSRMMSEYAYGIEALPELIGTGEDVARFDMLCTVAQSEVDSNLINKHHTPDRKQKIDATLAHALIMWCWSRTPDQIRFDKAAEQFILAAAKTMGRTYAPRFCLVQGEDVRYKLARVAAAIAGRLFSTEDGVILSVTKEHAEQAYNFLTALYAAPSCGYQQLSQLERERANLKDRTKVIEEIRSVGSDVVMDFIENMLDAKLISIRDVQDFTGLDSIQASSLISSFVRLRALAKDRQGYTKRPAFKALLQELRRNGLPKEHTTEADPDADTDDIDSNS